MTDDDKVARDRAAVSLITMTAALKRIEIEAAQLMDQGGAIGAGRRLERINREATAALEACRDHGEV